MFFSDISAALIFFIVVSYQTSVKQHLCDAKLFCGFLDVKLIKPVWSSFKTPAFVRRWLYSEPSDEATDKQA